MDCAFYGLRSGNRECNTSVCHVVEYGIRLVLGRIRYVCGTGIPSAQSDIFLDLQDLLRNHQAFVVYRCNQIGFCYVLDISSIDLDQLQRNVCARSENIYEYGIAH